VLRLLILASLGAGSESPVQDPLTLEQVRRQVDDVLGKNFSLMEPDRKRYLGDRVYASLLKSPSPEHTQALLNDLPTLAEFHSIRVEFYLKAGGPTSLPQPLIQEGYDLQSNIMVEVVNRAAAHLQGDADRLVEADQIQMITATAREVLEDRLPGEAGASLVRKEIEAQRRSWVGSQDHVYSAFLDRPLSAGELEDVLREIREKAREFTPVRLKEDQIRSRQVLEDLGVLGLFRSVIAAGDGATRRCFAELDPLDERARKWDERVAPHVQARMLAGPKNVPMPSVPNRSPTLSREEKARIQQSAEWRAERSVILGTSVKTESEEGGGRFRRWTTIGVVVLLIAVACIGLFRYTRRRTIEGAA